MTNEQLEKMDFITVEASVEEAGEMLAYILNECQAGTAQHIQVPGQSRDLVTFGFLADEYQHVAEISSEYERPMWDGILITRQPYRQMLTNELAEYMEHGRITSNDPDTSAQTEDNDD